MEDSKVRKHEREEEEDEEGDIGPMPTAEDDIGPAMPGEKDTRKKKKRILAHEHLYLNQLPSADMYERSYMHRDVLNHIDVSKTDFVITTSVDGHLKFWKKTENGIEFVKHYRSHLASIVAFSMSHDGALLATVSQDKSLKVYDVVNFDMVNIIKLEYVPKSVCWIYKQGQAQSLLAISEEDSPKIHIYDGRAESEPMHTLEKIHSAPVHLMAYNERFNCVVSADISGMIEYWEPEPPYELPRALAFEYKTETDLYEFKKSKTYPSSFNFSPDGTHFVMMCMGDRQVRVFKFKTGKLVRKYDESLQVISEMQQAGTAIYRLDDMEFGRRLAVEKELEKSLQASTGNAGIKVVNLTTNKVVRLIGKTETHRFLNMSLYQGAPLKKGLVTLAMAASDNPVFKESESIDPTLFCTAFKRNRFFMFTQREPDIEDSAKGDRDVFNEKPSREEQTVATSHQTKQLLGSNAIIRTTMGDIHIRLFPEYAPKAVENFATHARNGYYDNVIFHRVIKGFMLQTGDPLGDGTGGESIWGTDFEDEFHRDLRHDRPYNVSLANAGPNTNGSQLFITVVPTPWLDNKHTIFGRATAGMDVVHSIEQVKTDKMDKPYDDIRILNIEIR